MTFHVVPAVDLKGGRCVQLEQGDPERVKVALPDPVAAANRWLDAGATWLHVVDLDAALGSGDNRAVVRDVVAACDGRAAVQVGGGVRGFDDIDALLGLGVERVVVGTRAVTDPTFLAEAARRYGARLVLAVDARDGEVVVKGWREASGKRLVDFGRHAASLGVGALLFTDVGKEGLLAGAGVDATRELAAAVPGTPVIASGGIGSLDDVRALAAAGAWGAVVGMAIYTERFTLQDAVAAVAAEVTR